MHKVAVTLAASVAAAVLSAVTLVFDNHFPRRMAAAQIYPLPVPGILFGVYEAPPTERDWSGTYAWVAFDPNPPSLLGQTTRVASPTGTTWLYNPPFIESGATTSTCSFGIVGDCLFYPYASWRNDAGLYGERTDLSLILQRGGHYGHQVNYAAQQLLPTQDQWVALVETGNGWYELMRPPVSIYAMRYTASGGETGTTKSNLGIVDTSYNQHYAYLLPNGAGDWQYWCYTSKAENMPLGTISACDTATYGWIARTP